MQQILTVEVKNELDVLVSRQRARQITSLCGFNNHDQIRISTVVSELARNIYNYANKGQVEFSLSGQTDSQSLMIRIEDQGPGIEDLDLILSGRYHSKTGMGLGILSARRLMDNVEITTHKNIGTCIRLQRNLPAGSTNLTSAAIGSIRAQIDALQDNVALSEVQQQNKELAEALAAVKAHQEELLHLTHELRATNQTVVALNEELKSKAEQLQRADIRKDEFLAILGHELRNPLSAVSMASCLLEAQQMPPERAAQLGQVITRQTNHMSRLVEDLLDVSRVTRGLVAIDKKPVDMRTVVENTVEQVGPLIKRKSHKLAINVPDEACYVLGDMTRLVQVGSNLLSNAARYTPDGGTISVHLVAEPEQVVLRVTDNGIGIAPELLPRLFDLYVQAEHPTDGKNGGLGVGLALVKSIVELHSGTITASSRGKGEGSQFSVGFPRL